MNRNDIFSFAQNAYRWKGNVYHMPVIMRIGRNKSEVDNAHAGGMFIGVSNDGVLNDTAFTEFHKVYKQHPDSNLPFFNYRIPHFDKNSKFCTYYGYAVA